MGSKIKRLHALLRILAGARRRGKKIVFTNGCFDILHAGHVIYLMKARKLGGLLVVGLNSDRSVKRLKGAHRPVNSQADRATVLSALSSVDHIIIFSTDTPERLIRLIRPDLLVKGGDWRHEDIVGGDFVRSYGGKIVTIPFVKGRSTSAIIKKMANRGMRKDAA